MEQFWEFRELPKNYVCRFVDDPISFGVIHWEKNCKELLLTYLWSIWYEEPLVLIFDGAEGTMFSLQFFPCFSQSPIHSVANMPGTSGRVGKDSIGRCSEQHCRVEEELAGWCKVGYRRVVYTPLRVPPWEMLEMVHQQSLLGSKIQGVAQVVFPWSWPEGFLRSTCFQPSLLFTLWIRLESVTPFSALCRINQKFSFPPKKMLEDIQWTSA